MSQILRRLQAINLVALLFCLVWFNGHTTTAQGEIKLKEDGKGLERYRMRVLESYNKCGDSDDADLEPFCCNHTQLNQTLWGDFYTRDVTQNCSRDAAVFNGSQPCPRGYFCPLPFGQSCLVKCTPGSICPSFCGQEQECPTGYYCPTTSEQTICPQGFFCRAGAKEPERCSLFAVCPENTGEPTQDYSGAVLVICLAFIVFLFLFIYQIRRWCCPRSKLNKMQTEVHELVNFQKKFKHILCAWDLDKSMEEDFMDLTNKSNYENEDQADVVLLSRTRATSVSIPKPYTFTIEYKNINLELKKNKQRLVTAASGMIMPGNITAVMGPSGAGKSSFLAAITGKAHTKYTMTGDIVVNGKSRGLGEYHTDCAFVPQDDIMHADLKVREVLQYQAELRLPTTWSQKLKIQKVASVIRMLALEDVMDSLIGSPSGKRGISGGQRKRVNVGMELVADPTFIALDEPTSGLDSTSSLRVIQSLRQVAKEQELTVLVVLHQPRYEIFKQFDQLLLLAAGGTTAYAGPCDDAVPYFQKLGFAINAHTNPADFVLDAVCGTLKSSTNPDIDLVSTWANRPKVSGSTKHRNHKRNTSLNYNVLRYSPRKMPGCFWQTWTCLKREVVRFRRSPKTHFLDLIMVALGSACLGGAFMAPIVIDRFSGMCMISALVLSLTTMIIALRPFSSNLEILDREAASGLRITSHFFAVNVVQLPIFLAFVPIIFLACMKPMISPRASLYDLYVITASTTFATSGLGYLISTMFAPKSVQIVAIVFCLMSSQTAGNVPTIPTMNEMPLGPVVYQSSFARWYLEAMFEREALLMPLVAHVDVDRLAFFNGYTLDNRFYRCCGILVLFGFVSRVLSLFMLIYRTRKSIKPVKFTRTQLKMTKPRRLSSSKPFLGSIHEH